MQDFRIFLLQLQYPASGYPKALIMPVAKFPGTRRFEECSNCWGLGYFIGWGLKDTWNSGSHPDISKTGL